MIGTEVGPGERAPVIVAYGDELVRRVLAEHVRDCGYAVFEAAGSDEALAMIADPACRIDALLCDVAIAGERSGFGLTIEAKDLHPELRVMLTGSLAAAASAAVELCARAGQGGDPDGRALADRIKRALEERDAALTTQFHEGTTR